MSQREQTAMTINGSLHRLPLVLEILEEIHETEGSGSPGDEDLRRGSIRAVSTMAERLDRIVPAPHPVSETPSVAEQISAEWLVGERPGRFIPEPLLGRLSTSISRLLPFPPASMNRTGEKS
ncbi:MAG: hypothetical protein ABIT37_21090 [Luteolibacter sp.]